MTQVNSNGLRTSETPQPQEGEEGRPVRAYSFKTGKKLQKAEHKNPEPYGLE